MSEFLTNLLFVVVFIFGWLICTVVVLWAQKLYRLSACRLFGHKEGWYPDPPWECDRCGAFLSDKYPGEELDWQHEV